MSDKNETYSVMLRVRRITYEDAYISVPVSAAIMKRMKMALWVLMLSEAFVAEALRLSDDERVEWRFESAQRVPHPIQMPKPEDRQQFDSLRPESI